MFRLVIATVFALLIPNQDTLSENESFRWYPSGQYRSMGLINLQEAATQPFFEQFLACRASDNDGEFSYFGMRLPLPDSLAESVLWASFVEPKADGESSLPTSEGEAERIKAREKGAEIISGYLWTIRLAEPQITLESALKKGLITKTGAMIQGNPVLSLLMNKGKRTRYLAVLSSTGDLLAANSEKQLRKMYSAGIGKSLSLLDDQVYYASFEFYSGFGQFWYVDHLFDPNRVESDNENDNEVDPGENPISVVQSWDIRREEFISNSINIFMTEEAAAEMHEKVMTVHKDHGLATAATGVTPTERYEVNKNLFVHRKRYDADEIKRLLEAKKRWQEQQEQAAAKNKNAK